MDDNTKSEDKDDNAIDSVGALIGEAASDKDKTVAPSDSSSISAHISDGHVIKNGISSLR